MKEEAGSTAISYLRFRGGRGSRRRSNNTVLPGVEEKLEREINRRIEEMRGLTDDENLY